MPSSPMVDLPADVITDILSRLPVTSLLQFRSTSKSWRSLIDSDHFKALHLNKFHKLNSKFILTNVAKLTAVDLPTLSTSVKLNQPLNSYCITIIGSCDGLLCIKNVVDEIAIWNPSLRKHWILPSLSRPSMTVFGFGFDSFTGDYKLVRISYIGGNDRSTMESKVYLFSCRTNAWKSLPNIPYSICWHWHEPMGVSVDNTLHWAVFKGTHKVSCPNLIVAFDLRFEVFNELPLPELGEGFIRIKLSHFDGCLSMVVNYRFTRIDFWVKKQYGYKDSWFKLFTLNESPELRSLDWVWPLGYFKDGMKKVLFRDCRNKLFWYNLKSKQVSHVTIPGMTVFEAAIIWVESLVQPPFPSENYRKQQALECKINTSKRRCLRS